MRSSPAVELARALDQLPSRLLVYWIGGENFAVGAGLSAEVDRAVNCVVDEIAETVKFHTP